jgi:hypothetical protein
MKIRCPDHASNGLTPQDIYCHDHIGDIRQALHNIHCQCMDCGRALEGKDRHRDIVPLRLPRNRLESTIYCADTIFHKVKAVAVKVSAVLEKV